jgi:iron complex outermembrane receptor protein
MLLKSYFSFILLFMFCSANAGQVTKLEPMTIVSTPLHKKVAETIHPVNILTGKDLSLKQGTTIGGTLKQELGIHSSSFGSSVGQPVIRGQFGARVQVLQNGISSLDVTGFSPDHANSTEGMFAEQIEVLRGSASLLYGSGAIGGVVNIIDNRIPLYIPESPVFSFEQRYNSVSDGWSSALKHEGGVENFAWHVDGFFRKSKSYHVPSGGNNSGIIDNTDAQSWSGTFGSSWIDDWGMIGFSINHLDNNYGVPPVDELVRIDLQQTRYDLKAEFYEPFTGIESLKFRFAYNDYQHAELEDGVTVGTQFDNQGLEGRVELVHQKLGFFDHGAIGFQAQHKEFLATGEEAFVPPSTLQSYGIFAVEDIHIGDITYEAGLRVEHQHINTEGFNSTKHIPVNASLSALWHATDDMLISLAFTHAQRAPDIQELFSNGVHFATQRYESGDKDLKLETSYNLELSFKAEFDWLSTELNLFHNWSKDYIIQQRTGQSFNLDTEQINTACNGNCLPVYQAVQQDARFYGFESQISLPLWSSENNNLKGQIFADYVRGQLDTGGNVPRLPPLRYGMQLDYTGYKDFAAGLRLRVQKDKLRSVIMRPLQKVIYYWMQILIITGNFQKIVMPCFL